MKALFCISLIVILASCGNNTESTERADGFSKTATTPEDSLFDAVMEDHDIAMPKMKLLERSRLQLDARADSLKKLKSSATEPLQTEYRAVSAELKQAEDNMNKWMDEFVLDSAQNETPQRLPYLISQKEKVGKVKDDILSALAKADSTLKK